MKQRPISVTALAVAAVALGLYAMVAAIAMLLGGSIGTFAGADAGVAVMVLGAVMLGVGMASYFVGYGFWMQQPWSWVGGLTVAGVTVVAMLAMGLVGASYTSLVLPIVLGLTMIWYLLRPTVRDVLVPREAPAPEHAHGAGADHRPGPEAATRAGVAAERGA